MSLSLISLVLFVASNVVHANDFPARLSFVMKEKMSCRGAKKILRTDGLFVHCSSREGLSKEFSAEYFGRRPVSEIVAEVATHAKIEVVEPGEEQEVGSEVPNTDQQAN